MLVESAALQNVYRDILTGRRRVIGWGSIALFPYHCLQAPFLPEYIIDVDPDKAGHKICGIPIKDPQYILKEDPKELYVIIYPHYDLWALKSITKILKELNFTAIPPFRVEIDGPMVCTELNRLANNGTPHLARIDDNHIGAMLRNWSADQLRSIISRLQFTANQQLPPVNHGRAILLTGRLQPGGAERQLVYLATGMRQAGWNVKLVTYADTAAGAEHYAEDLAQAGVLTHVLPNARTAFHPEKSPDLFPPDILRIRDVLSRLPLEITHEISMAYRIFAQDRPELVICYLDIYNIVGSIAALMAGVPLILISGRNINPSHFPNHYSSSLRWLLDYYKLVASFSNLRLSANSTAGARSYAEWLAFPHSAVHTIPNGIPKTAVPPADPAASKQVRTELHLSENTPLIAGVFRLSVEKQPLLFIEVLRRVMAARPDVHAVLVGDGPQRPDVEEAVKEARLEHRIHLVGARRDARSFLGAADMLLHTAHAEGHPNVILEAQLLGRPVVCTDAAGTRECLVPWRSDHVHAVNDSDGLVRSCLYTLADLPTAQREMAEARNWVLDNFSLERLVKNTLAAVGLSTGSEMGA